MIRIQELKLPLESRPEDVKRAALKLLKLEETQITDFKIFKKSVDARKKDAVQFSYAVDITVDGNEEQVIKRSGSKKAAVIQPKPPLEIRTVPQPQFRPVVVGFGPAGMFAGLVLARAGMRPLVLERGKPVDQRLEDVKRFWEERKLNPESNVQFGEGGAGTFSDGKLNTGIKDPRCRYVLELLHEMGAPEEIVYTAKPHIGTDKLALVVKNVRLEIEKLGGEVLFESKLTALIAPNKSIHGVTYEQHGQAIDVETDTVILAIGHSARDTAEMLYESGIPIIQKAFSVGARIEHPQKLIDQAQYGTFAGHPALGAADYKLACHGLHERGAYTFCMCPGGTVVAAASEEGGVVVNGMSEFARDGENANSALLVGIEPKDFGSEHPLAGIERQREIERAAFRLAGADYHAPAQLVGDFLQNRASKTLGNVNPTCATGVTLCDLRDCLPKRTVRTMQDAIVKMNEKLRGFSLPDAVLTAPETRSSSPIRIVRDDLYQSAVRGLYPCGEGAGYAGGIISAAVDGIKCAQARLEAE